MKKVLKLLNLYKNSVKKEVISLKKEVKDLPKDFLQAIGWVLNLIRDLIRSSLAFIRLIIIAVYPVGVIILLGIVMVYLWMYLIIPGTEYLFENINSYGTSLISWISENYKGLFNMALVGGLIYLVLMSFSKIAKKNIKIIFWIGIFLSAVRLALYIWADWKFTTAMMVVISLLFISVFSLDYAFKKISQRWVNRKDGDSFKLKLPIWIPVLAFLMLGAFLGKRYLSIFHQEKVEAILEVAPIVITGEVGVEPIAITIIDDDFFDEEFFDQEGNSVWKFLEGKGVDKDLLAEKSVNALFSKYEITIVRNDGHEIFTEKLKKKEILDLYQKEGGKIHGWVPKGLVIARWNEKNQELTLLKK